MELPTEAESVRAMAKLGEAYTQYVIQLHQQIADMGKASRAQDKYIETLKKRRDETINQLNARLRDLQRQLETIRFGSPKQKDEAKEATFQLQEVARTRVKQ